jgi:predicted hydrocarbon binding protein
MEIIPTLLPATLPKRDFSVVEVEPGENLYEICIILKDVPGALAETAKVLANTHTNIKTGSIFYLPDGSKLGAWTSFIDISKAKNGINDIEKELRKLDTVVDVKFEKPFPAPFEVIHFPILHGDLRAIIMPIETFREIWEGFETILTPSGLEAVLYDVGKKNGTYYAKYLSEKYGVKGNELISAIIQASKATGWGIVELKNIHSKRPSGTIIVKECFEALARGKKPYKVCHWIRGFVAGFLSLVSGQPVEAVETKCLAVGDDHCEFEIHKKMQ